MTFTKTTTAMDTSIERLIHPHDVQHLPYVVVAALIGVTGNEVVAECRSRRSTHRFGSAGNRRSARPHRRRRMVRCAHRVAYGANGQTLSSGSVRLWSANPSTASTT
jgi:hypothetical protein